METSSRAFSWGSPSRWWEPPTLLPACGLVLPSSAQSLFPYPHIHQTVPLPPLAPCARCSTQVCIYCKLCLLLPCCRSLTDPVSRQGTKCPALP